jgi:hypothetical protein
MNQKTKQILVTFLILLGSIVFGSAFRDLDSPQQGQVYLYTPTAQTDGRIIYVVKSGDSCNQIALLMGISLDQLRLNNNLTDPECVLQPGEQLLIATVTHVLEPTLTTTPSGPTPTPFFGMGQICVLLFNDVNGNGMREMTETSIADGAISITDRSGQTSVTGSTDDSGSAKCFENLPEGDYNVSVAIPEGYNPTMNLNSATKIEAGDSSYLDFGAQPASWLRPSGGLDNPRSPLIGILGGVMILVGVGLGFYFLKSRKA